MAGKRKDTSRLPPVPRQEILETIRLAKVTHKDRALAAMLFLTGARIQEIVPNKKRGWRGLTVGQLNIQEIDDREFLVIDSLPTQKKRKGKKIFRTVAIPFDKDYGFIELIDTYLDVLKGTGELLQSQVLFPFTRQKAWQMIKKFNSEWYCHWFRHQRSTDLVITHGLTGTDLKEWHSWADSKQTDVYVHLDWQQIARRMRR